MSMDRRGFLGRLMGGLAIAATAPALDLVALVHPVAAHVAPLTYADALRDLVRDAAREFQKSLPLSAYRLVRGGRIGVEELTHHFSVEVNDDAAYSLSREQLLAQYIKPAMALLAQRADTMRVFGVLPQPCGVASVVVTNPAAGVSLRGLRAYSVGDEMAALRFDVVCG